MMMPVVCKTVRLELGCASAATVVRLAARQKNAAVDIATRFGKNLARCRKRADLSQEELAVRASLHRTAVGQLERGERVARVDTLIKLAGSLSIPPGELLSGMDWDPGGTKLGQFRARDACSSGSEAVA